MRRLILLRHAKTEPGEGMDDFQRRLLPRGRADAKRLAQWFHKNRQSADLLIHSDALRAAETADLIEEGWLQGRPRRAEHSLYMADWRGILKIARALPESAANAVIVGHNPGLAEAANILTGAGSDALRARLGETFPACACAVLDFGVETWAKVAAGGGTLSLFLTPEGF